MQRKFGREIANSPPEANTSLRGDSCNNVDNNAGKPAPRPHDVAARTENDAETEAKEEAYIGKWQKMSNETTRNLAKLLLATHSKVLVSFYTINTRRRTFKA